MISFAFVFARGGSKGLPRKNVKLLNGKPLIQFSIETALQVDSINQIFVSTEDEEISDIAKALGVTVIDRPRELATDTSSEWLSWRHAVKWVTEKFGEFDTFVSLPATSPLRSPEDVEGSIKQLELSGADVCISVTPSNRNPFFNMVKQDEKGFVKIINNPQGQVFRRQDAPEVFDITTVVYATRPRFIIEHQNLFEGRVTAINIPKDRAVDIDDIYDFKLVEAILQERQNA